LFQQKSNEKEIYGYHLFQKPWFLTSTMFFDMFLAFICYLFEKKPFQRTIPLKIYVYCSIPAFLDLISSTVMNIALLYVLSSVSVMFRGSKVFFGWF
jgi:ABC-type multidrug transport system permease subunit